MIRTRRFLVWTTAIAPAAALLGVVGVWRYQVTRPEHRVRQGQEALSHNDWRKAEKVAESLQSSGYADHAHMLRGLAYLHAGRLNAAINEYNQISSDNYEILVEASRAYGLGFLSLDKGVEAEQLLMRVARVHPDDLDAHRGLAAIYYDRGAMTKAVQHLQKWSELDDNDGQPHRFMGLIYKELAAREDLAVEHYQAALERRLLPEVREDVVLELADLLLNLTRFAEALSYLDNGDFSTAKALASAPQLRAECLYSLGRASDSLRLLQPLLNEGSVPLRSLRLRAKIHADAREYKAAVPLLEKALQMDPHEPVCRYELATIYEILGRHEEAAQQRRLLDQTHHLLKTMTDLNREANDKPADIQVRERLAQLCDQLGKFELAQTWRRAARSCRAEARVQRPAMLERLDR